MAKLMEWTHRPPGRRDVCTSAYICKYTVYVSVPIHFSKDFHFVYSNLPSLLSFDLQKVLSV